MTTIFPIDLKCPVCEKGFKSLTVGSFGSASMRTDFRPNYWGANPVSHFFHACPNCGFCADLNNYNLTIDNKKFKKEMKSIPLLEKATPQMKLTTKVERAVRCLEKMKRYKIIEINYLTLANKWLIAYWWADNFKEQ
ncbi:MAG: DUF2225 domain-containing protein [Promethearchaeota archaeon]|nr:MAG: DUF2225 domain-containing protein [Candidatus Lokiarchaeota archaeon]